MEKYELLYFICIIESETNRRNEFFNIIGIEAKDLPNTTIYNNKFNSSSSFIQALIKKNILTGDLKSLSNAFTSNLNENSAKIVNYYNEKCLNNIYDIDCLMFLNKDNNNYINIYTPLPNSLMNKNMSKESPYRSLKFEAESTQLIAPISPSFSFGHTPTLSDFKSIQEQQQNTKYSQLQQLKGETTQFPNVIETPILGSISLSKLLIILDEIPLSGNKEFNDHLNEAGGEIEKVTSHKRIESIISLINIQIMKCFDNQNILIDKSNKAYEYGLKLYYHSCSKIFTMERDRVRDINKYISLVKSDSFHRSLISIWYIYIYY